MNRLGQWAGLLAVSAPLSWLLDRAGFPAALLLGPMLAGLAFGLRGATVRIPSWGFAAAQAVIGCLVARAVTASIVLSFVHDWAVMVLVIATTIASGGFVGWTLMRLRVLPGNTAAWGSSPGGAAAMIAMAEEYGADVRLVAFMQYLRVLVVVLTASAVSRLLLGEGATALPAQTPATLSGWFEAPVAPFVETLAVAGIGAFLGRRFGIPAGAMLVPMLGGATLNSLGMVAITLPPWLLGAAYAVLGWFIGLRFTPGVVRHVLRAIPKLVLSTGLLMGLCGLSAWMLTAFLRIDALTAYLATSPGGLDSVAVIAVGSGADVPFVLALQTLRLVSVVLAGPAIARMLSRRG
ncbi:AbrB family transcriptional regulator [Fundidesulfovibrio butyratiphilus]